MISNHTCVFVRGSSITKADDIFVPKFHFISKLQTIELRIVEYRLCIIFRCFASDIAINRWLTWANIRREKSYIDKYFK